MDLWNDEQEESDRRLTIDDCSNWNDLSKTWISLAKICTNVKGIENDKSWKLIFSRGYCFDK